MQVLILPFICVQGVLYELLYLLFSCLDFSSSDELAEEYDPLYYSNDWKIQYEDKIQGKQTYIALKNSWS